MQKKDSLVCDEEAQCDNRESGESPEQTLLPSKPENLPVGNGDEPRQFMILQAMDA